MKKEVQEQINKIFDYIIGGGLIFDPGRKRVYLDLGKEDGYEKFKEDISVYNSLVEVEEK